MSKTSPRLSFPSIRLWFGRNLDTSIPAPTIAGCPWTPGQIRGAVAEARERRATPSAEAVQGANTTDQRMEVRRWPPSRA
jgi:hypothetical protein